MTPVRAGQSRDKSACYHLVHLRSACGRCPSARFSCVVIQLLNHSHMPDGHHKAQEDPQDWSNATMPMTMCNAVTLHVRSGAYAPVILSKWGSASGGPGHRSLAYVLGNMLSAGGELPADRPWTDGAAGCGTPRKMVALSAYRLRCACWGHSTLWEFKGSMASE